MFLFSDLYYLAAYTTLNKKSKNKPEPSFHDNP